MMFLPERGRPHKTLFDAVQSEYQDLADTVSSRETAKTTLEKLANKTSDAKSGPALLGTAETLDKAGWVTEAASLYFAAFGAGIQCFPYFTDAR